MSLHNARDNSKEKTWVHLVLAIITDALPVTQHAAQTALLQARPRLTCERGWVSWSSWSSWGVAWGASREGRSAGFSGGEAARAVPAPHTTMTAVLCKQNKWQWAHISGTSTAQCRCKTLTGVTSQTDKHQECKVCPWTTTHTIILSNSLWLPYTSIRTFLPKLQTFCISQEAEENLSEQYRDEEWMKQKDMG